MKKKLSKLVLRIIGFLATVLRLLFKRKKGNIKRMRMFDMPEPPVRLMGECLVSHEVIDEVETYHISPPKKSNNRKIIYLHGGAFISGPVLFHWQMLARMGEMTGSEIVVVLYRKSPEHTYPAQMDDLMKVYHQVRQTTDPSEIIFMGDSAGGGLAAAAVQKLRDEGTPMPGKVVLLSPWLDLLLTNPDIPKLEKKDKFLDRESVARSGRRYAGENDPQHPYLSPVRGNLAGLPKTLLMIGTMDLLLFDCRLYRDKAVDAGAELDYQEWDNMFHDWMCLTSILSEAEESVKYISGFLEQ
ncbi:MAG: alpha/beta hydrolase [Bacteroidales bacterium]|jgi:acetyl esterase/lipase|nr:alpha/beta hydrolase [Bacteroidales bacterium]MDD2571399.1 alpha/beta hydrolase fold domain-containing protein [Bacteroidales bacterium]MDD2812546.1 alpha/beta hydrolase fold domain-containing protein [Bacteroidales bacterium]MDD3385971.1 alpha/beta hydrolase fold domain-containing protein [Bacteroidales bacterium]MDD3811687.1 alpha/beta hydrolase fold domain-containing protein [Bacteroidales bacterium]